MRKLFFGVILAACMVVSQIPVGQFEFFAHAADNSGIPTTIPTTFTATYNMSNRSSDVVLSNSGSYLIEQNDFSVRSKYGIEISGSASTTIYVYIKNVNIDASLFTAINDPAIDISGAPTVYLFFIGGRSELTAAPNRAAIQKNMPHSTLGVFAQAGTTVVLQGGHGGAGIGGVNGDSKRVSDSADGGSNIIIGSPTWSGTIEAHGNWGSAGIGGGLGGIANNITIKGGNIDANGGKYGAGIGSGRYGKDAKNITIESGNISAVGGYQSAGIGGGKSSPANNIYIKGGIVDALGGSEGAGIGGGGAIDPNSAALATATTIEITGGTVTARSIDFGAAIGGGAYGEGKDIRIKGGIVNAYGNDGGAGIGGGVYGNAESISLSGGKIRAEVGSTFYSNGATAIGRGGGWHWKFTPEKQVNINIENGKYADFMIKTAQELPGMNVVAIPYVWKMAKSNNLLNIPFPGTEGTYFSTYSMRIDIEFKDCQGFMHVGNLAQKLDYTFANALWKTKDMHVLKCIFCDGFMHSTEPHIKSVNWNKIAHAKTCTVCAFPMDKDNTAPTFVGVIEGMDYYADRATNKKSFTITDYEIDNEQASGVDWVKIDGVIATPDGQGKYYVNADNKTHLIEVEDFAGNKKSINISVYKKYLVSVMSYGSTLLEKEVNYGGAVSFGLSTPGLNYLFVMDGSMQLFPNQSENYIVSKIKEDKTIQVTGVMDNTNPTGTIGISGHSWSAISEEEPEVVVVASSVSVTLTAADTGANQSGVASTSYLVSEIPLTLGELALKTGFKTYVDAFYLESLGDYIDGKTYYVYSKISDRAGNTTYLSTPKIIVKTLPPPPPSISITANPNSINSFNFGGISGNLTVSGTASNNSTVSYQWYQNRSALNTGGTLISGATNANFPIPADLTSGYYYYYCVLSATEASDATSSVATIAISQSDPGAPSQTEVPTVLGPSIISLHASGNNKAYIQVSLGKNDNVWADHANVTLKGIQEVGDITVSTVPLNVDGVIEVTGTKKWGTVSLSFSGGNVSGNEYDRDIIVFVTDDETPVSLGLSHTEGGTLAGMSSGDYLKTTLINVTAMPNDGYYFVGWETDDLQTLDEKNPNATFPIMVAVELQAIFAPISANSKYLLTIANGVGGNVDNTLNGEYIYNTNIPIVALANDGYCFLNWTATGINLIDDTDSSIIITMPKNPVSLIANFEPIPIAKYDLLLQMDAGGGIIGTANGIYEENASISVTATAKHGYRFAGWLAEGVELIDSASSMASFFMPANPVLLIAKFAPEQYALTVVETAGGSVNGTPNGNYEEGALIFISAIVDESYEFAGWTAVGITLADSTESQLIFNMPANAMSLTAKFAPIAQDATIASFEIEGASGVIDNILGTIAVTVSHETAITAVTPDIALTDFRASISPTYETAQDFTKPISYTVLSRDRTIQKNYVVTVTAMAPTPSVSGGGGNSSSGDSGGGGTTTDSTQLSELGERAALDDIEKASDGGTVTIPMSGATNIPTSILEEARGKDINVVLDFGDYTWTINGNDIGNFPSDITSFNLAIVAINENILAGLANGNGILQLELSHNGPLPFSGTLTYNVPSSYNGQLLYLYYYNESTGRLQYSTSGIVEDGKIKLAFKHASKYVLTAERIAVFNPFTDVKDTDWFYNAVMNVYDRGLFAGTAADKFSPQMSMTRAMFATVLARFDSADLSSYKTSPFTDVDISTWYGPSVAWAADNGILSGYGGGLFAPNDNITREQMAVIISNYIKFSGVALPATGSNEKFSDNAHFSPWAIEAISDMRRLGLISGVGGNKYNPKGTATRAEVAQIFTNFIDTAE